MGIERPMRMRWESRYAKALDVQYRAQRFDLLRGFTGQMLSAASSVVILWIGASLVLDGQLTIGQLIAFTMLMGSAMAPVMGLIGLWDQLQETGVAMERLGDVLDLEPEQKPQDIESRIMLPSLKGDLRFDNVFFRYGGKENRFVLENIRFSIEPGQMARDRRSKRLRQRPRWPSSSPVSMHRPKARSTSTVMTWGWWKRSITVPSSAM